MKYNSPRWSQLSSTGEKAPPTNPEEQSANSWPLHFLKRDGNGWFMDPFGDPIPKVKDPNTINWEEELKKVEETIANLTIEQQVVADYWGTGHATKQWIPIIDCLVDSYTIYKTIIPPESLSTPRAARILALTQSAIADAVAVAWAVKYQYDVARPNQQNQNLPTYIGTPRHPSYVSGHAIVAGVASEVLSYFFPTERTRLVNLAEECAVAQVLGGVHFPVDGEEGLRLGRVVGQRLTTFFSSQTDEAGNPIDIPFTDNKKAKLPPGCYPFKQAISFKFIEECQSDVMEKSLVEKNIKTILKRLYCSEEE